MHQLKLYTLSNEMNSIRSLCPGRQAWKIRARVIRKWEMEPNAEPSKPYAMQLVLIDSEGCKIEANIKKYLMSKFQRDIVEGNVYIFTFFVLVDNNGAYRAAEHEYKILFNSKTKVQIDQCDTIPMLGLTLKDTSEIKMTMGESDYLMDIIGLVTAVSDEQQFPKSGNVTRRIEMEITDDKGKIKMSLFGKYVDMVKGFLAADGVRLAVIIVQFAKVKTYRGEVVIQNVMQATKLFWNADIPEVSVFRDGIALHGLDSDLPIGKIGGGFRNVPANEEFISMYPKKNIVELHDTAEEGLFIVLGKISGLIEGEKWWYASCQCRKAVTIEDGLYYCGSCCTHVVEFTPRFRLKFEVCDGDELATFVMFDTDCQNMLGKSCRELVMFSKGKASDEYPDDIKALIGKEALFKVEKLSDHGTKYDDSYKVKKTCDDKFIIDLFNDKTKIETPTKLIIDPYGSNFESDDKEPLFTDSSLGSASQFSSVADTNVSLDDISPFGDSAVSVPASKPGSEDGSTSKPPRKKRLVQVKNEK
ncbi:uncharacterized protein LOC130731626 isoform X1 [Lotus japonicus]|uniref:uncharacterized protein LOC130731626 isoform X1 n=2 Tax=Lotus japonicus TaxID=34305 RepID=UPI0025843712|nr:uncharacterized protein LOC130731626 isoform X1 [Lotus japonicus]